MPAIWGRSGRFGAPCSCRGLGLGLGQTLRFHQPPSLQQRWIWGKVRLPRHLAAAFTLPPDPGVAGGHHKAPGATPVPPPGCLPAALPTRCLDPSREAPALVCRINI